MRKGKTSSDTIAAVCNFTPIMRSNYRVGVPSDGFWREALNSDAEVYGGSGHGNLGGEQEGSWQTLFYFLELAALEHPYS